MAGAMRKGGVVAAALVAVMASVPIAAADQGLLAGVDAGVAVPVGKFKDRANTGGALSPYVGYMFTDTVGLLGQAQVMGMGTDKRPGEPNEADTVWAVGVHAGPRLALPFSIGGVQLEPYGTWQAGVFTGLTGNTPISRTSWGYTAGGGLNLRLTDALLVGGFARYNHLDQRVTPGHDVEYVTAGVALTYNMAAPPPPPPPPPPVVAKAPPKPAPKRKIVLRGVHFDFNKATIRADARPILDEAIATLRAQGGIIVIAQGHTDSIGTPAYNQKLSEERAWAVKKYLVAGGIAGRRIGVEGFGESRPVASNDTADGRAQNRRVELQVTGN